MEFNFSKLISKTRKSVSLTENSISTFINPYSYLLVRKNPEIVEKIDHFFIDGISLVLVFNFFLCKKFKRYSFDMTSMAKKTFEFAVYHNKTVYFVGTKPEILNKSIAQIIKYYPKMKITGFHHGYFCDEKQWNPVIDEIINKKADIVIVGMGTPRQERFLLALKEAGWNGIGFTCGGFLHQITEGLHYYPRMFDIFHIRWLYRIFKEPYLLKRYLCDYSIFFAYFAKDCLFSFFSKK